MYCLPPLMYVIGLPVGAAGSTTECTVAPVALSIARSSGGAAVSPRRDSMTLAAASGVPKTRSGASLPRSPMNSRVLVTSGRV